MIRRPWLAALLWLATFVGYDGWLWLTGRTTFSRWLWTASQSRPWLPWAFVAGGIATTFGLAVHFFGPFWRRRP